MKNYKNLNIIKEEEIKKFKDKKILELCIFSRINKEKGIIDAMSVIQFLNDNEYNFKLDIYGMIEKSFEKEFAEKLNECSKFVKYKGIIDSNKSVDVIKKYDLLLFPTKYYTEGIPGTIIDSYASGVPVIASNWQNCEDVVINKKTGLIFEFNNLTKFKEKLIYAYHNQKKIYCMKNNCIEHARLYCSIETLKPLFDILGE